MISKKLDKTESNLGNGKLSTAINLISEGTELTGNIKSSHSIRISGTINGSVDVEAKCILANGAIVKGDIVANEADISGTVSGDIHVSSKLVLRYCAHVYGNVVAKTISIEEGATFEGACTMSANPIRKTVSPESDFNIRQITQAYRR
jgi:cytoskeletal protein CcmA (bactofilin family)